MVIVVFSFLLSIFFFFFNDTATTEIYTLSLHDALPICPSLAPDRPPETPPQWLRVRSEEHTSELQSPDHLVCRLLLEKKKKTNTNPKTQKTTKDTPQEEQKMRPK